MKLCQHLVIARVGACLREARDVSTCESAVRRAGEKVVAGLDSVAGSSRGRTPDFGSGGWRFESSPASQMRSAQVAHALEVGEPVELCEEQVRTKRFLRSAVLAVLAECVRDRLPLVCRG